MILNSRLQSAQIDEESSPVLLIHGLFGSMDNLGVLARSLHPHRTVLQVDVRNHGRSPRAAGMDYAVMAQDMLQTLDNHHLDQVNVIGHSMGGKIAMAMTALAPERVKRLVIIDIAPSIIRPVGMMLFLQHCRPSAKRVSPNGKLQRN